MTLFSVLHYYILGFGNMIGYGIPSIFHNVETHKIILINEMIDYINPLFFFL